MSDDAIRALRAEAAQKEAEAKAIEASQAAAVAAQPPAGTPTADDPVPADLTPGQAYVQRQQQAAEPGQEFTMADFDRMSPREQREFALTDEGDAAVTAAIRREG
jgi:hypothetical protein